MNKHNVRAMLIILMIVLYVILLPIVLAACGSEPTKKFDQAHQDSYNFLQPYADFTVLHRHDGSRIGCDVIMRDLGAAAEPNNYNFSEVQRLKTEYNTYCRQWR